MVKMTAEEEAIFKEIYDGWTFEELKEYVNNLTEEKKKRLPFAYRNLFSMYLEV